MQRTVLGTIAVMLMWALCYPLIKISLPYAPVMMTAFLRALIAGSCIIILAILIRRPFPKGSRVWFHICLIGLCGTSLGLWGMFYAGSLLSPGLATVLTNTQPLIAGVLGWYFLKERVGIWAWLGTLVGFIGIIVISFDTLFQGGSDQLHGIMYVILASSGVAASNVLLKKIAGKVDVLFAMGFQLLIGGIPLAIMAYSPASFAPAIEWGINYITVLITLALVGTALPYVTWFWLIHSSPLFKLNIYNFLTPVFGLYLGYSFFSESLTNIQWVGVSLIIVAISLVTISNGVQKLGKESDSVR